MPVMELYSDDVLVMTVPTSHAFKLGQIIDVDIPKLQLPLIKLKVDSIEKNGIYISKVHLKSII